MNLSYSIGMLVADNFKSQGITDLNPQDLAEGIADMLNGTPKITVEVAAGIYEEYAKEMGEHQFGNKLAEGELFLAENAQREGVHTTESGLQYEIIHEGAGLKPSATDKVLTHYHGTLLNGEVFDSSVRRGQPIEFGVNQVISGWTEALQLMPCGSKWRLFIPSHLAYGDRGAGGAIGPFETLIFEVELIAVNGVQS
ncbi:MAG: FKBP-type peptidyl-prolyl cis-trans isomerase [Saprospiraceae bacterium]